MVAVECRTVEAARGDGTAAPSSGGADAEEDTDIGGLMVAQPESALRRLD